MVYSTAFDAQTAAGRPARLAATVARSARPRRYRTEQEAYEARQQALDRSIQTTVNRGATLLQEGYTIEPIDAFRGLFFVRRPEPAVDRKTGEVICEGYEVNVVVGSCSCPMFARSVQGRGDGVCKHVLAARAEVRKAFAILGLLPADAEYQCRVVWGKEDAR